MLSRRYVEEKLPIEKSWISSLEKWLKKFQGYRMLSKGPATTPSPVRKRMKIPIEKLAKKSPKRFERISSARPVLIIERNNQRPLKHCAYRMDYQPIINFNDHFIEVYYYSKTCLNYPGQLERYARASNFKECHCYVHGVPCKADRSGLSIPTSYNRHRKLNQNN